MNIKFARSRQNIFCYDSVLVNTMYKVFLFNISWEDAIEFTNYIAIL